MHTAATPNPITPALTFRRALKSLSDASVSAGASMKPSPHVLAAVVALVAFLLSGCGGGGASDKAGATKIRTTTLTLANSLGEPKELQAFADQVNNRSHGTLRIRFSNHWREGQLNYEPALINDVAAGKADLGWVGSRAWDALAVHSFDALTAPFALDRYALERDVLQSDIPDGMLRSIDRFGIVGLGVLPGPLRYLLAASRPLLRPPDFAGLRVGYQRGPARHTLLTLGAKPVVIASAAEWRGIDAIEQQIASINANAYDQSAKHLTANVPLWPRPFVLFANPRLSEAQRSLLHDALRAAIPGALKISQQQERDAMASLCRRGIDAAQASDQDKAALSAAVAPVLKALRHDPHTRAALESITAMRARTGPEPALTCSTTTPSAGVLSDGTYTTHVTRADIRAFRADRTLNSKEIDDFVRATFSLVLNRDSFALHIKIPGTSGGIIIEGTFSVYRDRFVATGTTGTNGDVVRARFSVNRTSLRFQDVKATEDLAVVFGARPWKKR